MKIKYLQTWELLATEQVNHKAVKTANSPTSLLKEKKG